MQIFQMENRSENIRNVEKFIGQVLHEQVSRYLDANICSAM